MIGRNKKIKDFSCAKLGDLIGKSLDSEVGLADNRNCNFNYGLAWLSSRLIQKKRSERRLRNSLFN